MGVRQIGLPALERAPDFLEAVVVDPVEENIASIHRETLKVFPRGPFRHDGVGEAACEVQLEAMPELTNALPRI